MTITEMLENAQQALVKMNAEDGDNLEAINTWANAARAYSDVAQATVLHNLTSWSDGAPNAVLQISRYGI